MPVVNELHEGGNLRAGGDLLRAHTLRHLPRVLLDARDDAMAERVLVRSLVIGLEHDTLLASVFPLQKNDNFALLDTIKMQQAQKLAVDRDQ